jgi:DNA-binding CsgD family transcriptional regulator
VSRSTVEDRFWSKVDKGPDCWLWTAATVHSGRGQFRTGAGMQQAHRAAWELTYGVPPLGLLRSQCGDLRCVRPDHQVVAASKVGRPRNLARTADKRFESFVRKGPDCWTWEGSTMGLGYGQFMVLLPSRGRTMVPAHRFAWEQAFGPIPDRADVVHRCGNLRCVRPDHLTLSDPAQVRRLPTSRQLQILRVWVDLGMKWKSHTRIGEELGLRPQSVARHLYLLRKRLGVRSTPDAVRWLDAHRPEWRDPGPA